jgi:Cytochrome P460
LIRSSTNPLDKVTQRMGHRPRHRLIQRKNSAMKTLSLAGIGIAGIGVVIAVAAHGQQNTAASNNEPEAETVVDAHGDLHVPDAYRTTYQALGSWAVAADHGKGSKELHVVYASPGTIAAYRESGHFPDGAVLVKEVFDAATGKMATGTVSRAEKLKGWFVMMKDTKGRYAGNKLWGDGSGWSWFDAANPAKTTSTDYKTDCQPCHVPARTSDWVYVVGYPPLRR